MSNESEFENVKIIQNKIYDNLLGKNKVKDISKKFFMTQMKNNLLWKISGHFMKPKPKNEETMSTIVSSFTQEFIEEYDLEQQFSTWQTEIKNHPYYLKFFNKYQQIANDDPLIKV